MGLCPTCHVVGITVGRRWTNADQPNLLVVCPSCLETIREEPRPECPVCRNDNLVVNSDGNTVCAECGAVASGIGFDLGGRVAAVYKRVFYFNELLSQFCLFEPPVPEELLGYIRLAAEARGWKTFSRTRIQTLCRSVATTQDRSIPRCYWIKLPIEVAYRHSTKTGRPLHNFRKFGEKWRRIQWQLGGPRPPMPTTQCLEVVRVVIGCVSRAFEQVRHTADCPCIPNCHRRFGCRHNIIDSNYILKKAFLYWAKGDRTNPEYLAFKAFLPQPTKRNRQVIRQRYWNPICRKLGWTYWDTRPNL